MSRQLTVIYCHINDVIKCIIPRSLLLCFVFLFLFFLTEAVQGDEWMEVNNVDDPHKHTHAHTHTHTHTHTHIHTHTHTHTHAQHPTTTHTHTHTPTNIFSSPTLPLPTSLSLYPPL